MRTKKQRITLLAKQRVKDKIEKKCINICSFNARSVKNMAEDIAELINDEKVDICAITETWIVSGHYDNIQRNQQYAMIHKAKEKHFEW